MKKYLIIGMCIVLSTALLMGCGSKEKVENVSQPDHAQQTTEKNEETTEATTTPTTLPVEIFVPVYEPDREELPTHEKAEQIIKGMTLNQVCRIMGNPQRNLEDGGMCPQWDIDNGEKLKVRCEKDDSWNWYVTYAEIEYPAPSMTEKQAQQIAQELIERYRWQTAVGVCCDFTVTYDNLSKYLNEDQAKYYYKCQYRLDCCHSAQEVREHINQVIDPELVGWYPDEMLFQDDSGELYLIVIPMGMDSYYEVMVTDYNNNQITAKAEVGDESGIYGTTTFVMNLRGDAFQISMVKMEMW